MKPSRTCWHASLLMVAFVAAWTSVAQAADHRVQFNRDVRPILSDTCFKCHGFDHAARQGELRLDVREEALRPRSGERTRTPIVPGNLQASDVWRRIISDDPGQRMPPPDSHLKLSAQQKEMIRRWIEQGAEYDAHWAFTPVEQPAVPEVAKGWARNEIDAFVLDRLHRESLEPAHEADKASLIRRVTFDLTGLPPTLEEIEAFVSDASPDAYEKVVDRLLASPRYGERMTVDWLDAARYADTHGFNNDSLRTMWRWRDWVIEAFNDNKPYDAFITEQLAGDLLPNATLDQKIASGFNRNHVMNSEGGIIGEEYRVEYVVDRTTTAGTVFLGLTLQCARCHDHKYDPITQKEFYQLFAFFNQLDEVGEIPRTVDAEPLIKAPTPAQQKELAALARDIASAEAVMKERLAAAESNRQQWEPSLTADLSRLPQPSSDGLVVHLPLDEQGDSITTVADPARSATGSVSGSVQSSAGRLAGAITLDGSASIDLGAEVAKFGRNDKFSYGGWVQFPAGGGGTVIARMDHAAEHRGFDLRIMDGKPEVHLINRWPSNAIRIEAKSALSADQWHHVFVTYDGSSKAAGFKVYVDGAPVEALVTRDGLGGGAAAPNIPLRIGRRNVDEMFKGKLDDIRIYARQLNPEEVQSVTSPDYAAILGVDPAQRTALQRESLRNLYLQTHDQQYQQAAANVSQLRAREIELNKSIPTVMVMQDMSPPRQTFILNRGAYDAPTDPVEPGVPEVLPAMPADAPRNRLGLAQWITDRGNPLASRVAVNRFWYQYFGVGLVKTLEDWGVQGEAPSHPDLLDWLADSFMRSGWDVKLLQRLIVTSATYRQAAVYTPALLERDPENRLLARGPRMRLSAEAIRDNALALSGLLVEELGGPSVMPYQPPGLWEDVVVGANYPGTKYVQGHGEDLYRRSMYTFWKRTAPPPGLNTFDAPEREFCQVRRPQTNTPLQALVLLNDPTYLEASRKIAERMMREGGRSPDERIAFAFKLATARAPSADELEVLCATFDRRRAHYKERHDAAGKLLTIGESARDEALDANELAAYTTIASMILNLDEVITK